ASARGGNHTGRGTASGQRVPQGHGQGLLVQQGALFRLEQVLADDALVDVGGKPLLAAGEVALLAGGVAPAVFDLPAVGPAVCAEVDPAEHHAVVHGALAAGQPGRLVHGEVQPAQHRPVLEAVGVPIAVGAVAVGVAVAAEADRLAGLQLTDG